VPCSATLTQQSGICRLARRGSSPLRSRCHIQSLTRNRRCSLDQSHSGNSCLTALSGATASLNINTSLPSHRCTNLPWNDLRECCNGPLQLASAPEHGSRSVSTSCILLADAKYSHTRDRPMMAHNVLQSYCVRSMWLEDSMQEACLMQSQSSQG
jgi:hypothetical protein